VPVASRQIEALSVEHPHDLGGGPQPQEALEDQPEPLLDLDIGVLDNEVT
jgi:hypothetical protein